jgi:drug/metabolite transporter (DMT)-like permease
MWIAALCIVVYLYLKKRLNFKGTGDTKKILFAGAIIAAHWITFFHAIKISNISVTLAAVSTGAFFGSLIEPIAYKRKIDWTELLLGLFVVAGLYLIFRFEGDYTAGIIVALISAFLAASFSVINSKLVKGHSPTRITLLEMLGGLLAISLFSMYQLINTKMVLSDFAIVGMDWIYLLVLGSICTAYAFIESVAVMKHLSSYTVLLTTNLEPVYGIIMALLFFNETEKMDPYFYLGATIIIFTVVADGYLKKRRKKQLSASA